MNCNSKRSHSKLPDEDASTSQPSRTYRSRTITTTERIQIVEVPEELSVEGFAFLQSNFHQRLPVVALNRRRRRSNLVDVEGSTEDEDRLGGVSQLTLTYLCEALMNANIKTTDMV